MFIGWHNHNFPQMVDDFAKDVLCDKNLIIKTWIENKTICFGAYKNDELMGMISAYIFNNSILINNFYYKEEFDFDNKERLLSLLLKNINDSKKTIMILVSEDEKELFKKCEFNEYAPFYKALYNGFGTIHFDAKSDDNSTINYLDILRKNDLNAFGDDRFFYITQVIVKSSSLMLGSHNGYQHSYALSNSVIKISPWIMQNGAFDDSHNLLKGIIHHRGLKKIISFIPAEVQEITDIYSACKFDFVQKYTLMYINKRPTIALDMIYGF